MPSSEPPDSYAESQATICQRTVTSESEAHALQAQINSLLDTRRSLSGAESNLLSLLGDLIAAWEGNRHDVPDIHGWEAIKELLIARGWRQSDLVGPVFATRSVASEVLSGRRPLSYETVCKPSAFFEVSPAVFFPR